MKDLLKSLKILLKRKNRNDIYHYILGNWRYKLYYSKFKFLIRKHIREQIDFRIKAMDPECYERGTCKLCGCTTTALQMCNKACDKPCYPPMMSKKEWKEFYDGGTTIVFRDLKFKIEKEDNL